MIADGVHVGRRRVIRVGRHFLFAVGCAVLLCEGLILWLALGQGSAFPLGALIVVAVFCSPLVIWTLRMRLEVYEDSLLYVPGLGPRKILSFRTVTYSDANFLVLRVFVAEKHSPFLSIRLVPLSKKDQIWLTQLPQLKLQK